MLEWLTGITGPWNKLYSDNQAVSTAVIYLHLAAIMVAGSAALSADRRMLRSRKNPALRAGYLEEAPSTHRIVIGALAFAFIAGVLMFLGDVEALAGSGLFWTKLTLVALLLTNGFVITRIEKRLRSGWNAGTDQADWGPLLATARISQILWFATLLAGIALRNI